MSIPVGKDAPFTETIERFSHVFEELGLDFTVSDWLNPLPHAHSVHIALSSCTSIYANGKGTTREAALASALGELIERTATHCSFADYFLGLDNSRAPFVHYSDERWHAIDGENEPLPEDLLSPSLRRFYCDPEPVYTANLVDLQSSSFSRGVCSIPFVNSRNGEIVYFPVNLLDNLYGSNGMSAGNTEYEALVQGLSEIVERYVKREIIRRGLALPPVPGEILERYPEALATLKELQGGGLQAICYDASLGGKFPVVCVVLFNQRNGTCMSSFGAHPVFQVALERTLSELLQGRTFGDMDTLEEPVFDLSRTADPVNLESHFIDSTGLLPMQMFRSSPDFRFVAWDFSGPTKDQYKALRYMIDKLGFDIFIRSYPQLGVPVYRIVVPGLSEVYPVDDLIYGNNNRAIDFQESLLSLPASKETPETYAAYLEELEEENAPADAPVSGELGVLPDPGTAWETLRLGEYKCLLALAARKWDKGLEYAQWTESFCRQDFPLDRLRFYQCLIRMLQCRCDGSLRESEYMNAFETVYGAQTCQEVSAHLDGHMRFYGLTATDLNLSGFKLHQDLLKVYAKIRETDEARTNE